MQANKHPTPIPLSAPGQEAPVAYMCPACRDRGIYTSVHDPAWAIRAASICCSTTCDTCGGPKPVRGHCSPCQRKREEEVERNRFNSAIKITEWAGPVYVPGTDLFAESIKEALERMEDEREARPAYLWPCSTLTAQIDPGQIVEGLTEEMHEDYEVDDYEGLVAFCKEWNAKQTGETWEPNYSRVIVLPAKESE